MDKQTVVHSYNGILIQQQKKWVLDTYSNINRSQKHDVAWKKPDTKECNIVWIHFLETLERAKAIYRDGHQGSQTWEREEWAEHPQGDGDVDKVAVASFIHQSFLSICEQPSLCWAAPGWWPWGYRHVLGLSLSTKCSLTAVAFDFLYWSYLAFTLLSLRFF